MGGLNRKVVHLAGSTPLPTSCSKHACLFLFTQIIPEQSPAVFILMAVDTEIFPVRTIRGIIIGISVFVVYRQKVPVLMIELPGTFGADEPVNLK